MLLIPLLTIAVVAALLLVLHISPLKVFEALYQGSFGSWRKITYTLSIWIPLLLCSCGLLFTFRAGLWNIGVEGQVIWGAIGTTAVLRSGVLCGSPALTLVLAFFCGFLCGALWGCLVGVLKNRGGVNEIFGGLGLNFVAQGFVLWLILSPWKREGIASMSGTDLFPRELWLTAPKGWQVAPEGIVLAVGALLICALLLGGSRFGLQLTACGTNARAARLFGINPEVTGLIAITIGGGLAGLAGAIQTSAVYHRLLPSISSGYGYLALLVVMLATYRILPVPFISLLFAGLAAGSIQLPIVLQLDSSLSGVIQGGCVVCALLVAGIRQYRRNQVNLRGEN